MAIDLRDKPILITGASSGIGRATALACAGRGMPVLACARRVDLLDSLVEEIRSAGGQARSVPCDVTDPDACREAVDACVDAFGSIYAVYANAGFSFYEDAAPASDERLRSIFETNFFGSVNTVRPALEHMRRARSGHVLVCSSILSLLTIPWHGAYCATKGAQHHFTRALRAEVRDLGIRVSSVHPVGTRTELFDKIPAQSPPGFAGRQFQTPMPFMQSPERVAGAIVRCLRRPRPEVWTSVVARYAAVAQAGLPRTSDLVLRVMGRRGR